MHKLILAALVAFTAASHADTGIDRSYALYRIAVTGDTTVRLPQEPSQAVEVDRRVPGAYARYLIYLGHSKSDAIALAERAGEAPTVADADPVHEPLRLTSYETYQLAVQGRTEAEILANRSSGARQHARSDAAGATVR